MAMHQDERRKMLVEIGERIRFARRRKQMTGAAFAKAVGVGASDVSRVEKGEQMFDVMPLIAARDVLGVSTDWILTGQGPLPEVKPAAPKDRDRRRRERDSP